MLSKIRNCVISFFLLLIVVTPAFGDEATRITAVAATSGETNSQINKLAARAPYFFFFDEQNRLLATEKNPNSDASRGAGTKTADFLAEKKVNIVIAEQFGTKMLDRLKFHKIKAIEKQGNVIDAAKE